MPDFRHLTKPWLLLVGGIAASFFVHELGHCAVAWLHGYPAVPTPVKEYLLKPVPPAVQNQVALGGLLGSTVALLAAGALVYRRPTEGGSALFAGAVTAPGFYTLRFVLAGRGHDGTEFQEAQAAIGVSYPGHAADWFFVGLLVLSTGFWFWRTRRRLTLRLAGRLLLGALVALVVLVVMQSVNNAVFDPLFQERPGHSRGAGSDHPGKEQFGQSRHLQLRRHWDPDRRHLLSRPAGTLSSAGSGGGGGGEEASFSTPFMEEIAPEGQDLCGAGRPRSGGVAAAIRRPCRRPSVPWPSYSR